MSSISINDFSYKTIGTGRYSITYISPATGKEWTATIADTWLTDATILADNPRIKDLNKLKRLIKTGGNNL